MHDFWDSLAPYHARIENSYLDLPSVRRLLPAIHQPVLVVGAGQGLIVAELRKRGLCCDGIDLSAEMVRYARSRRGLELIHADARAMPFAPGSYETIIYATGVIDFMSDDQQIHLIMNEGRRVAGRSGTIFVAFYRLSAATEQFMVRLGLLRDNVLLHREALAIHQLQAPQAIAWVAKRAKASYSRAVFLSLWAWAFSTWQEKRNAFYMQKIFAQAAPPRNLIETAAEQQPYRNAVEIRKLWSRLAIPINGVQILKSCFIVEISA